METRFIRLWAVLVPALCVSAVAWVQTGYAATTQNNGIDTALLGKANAGDAKAQYQLGNMYNFGRDGVRRNYAQALLWYRKAAEQGDAKSEFELGGLYHFGNGVPQDDAQGFAWIMKAAEQGHEDAEFFISTCYGEGWGVAKDEAQEVVWLRKAAERGHAKSQYMLGWAYEDGVDRLPKDYAQAYYWLDLAATESDSRKDRKVAVKKRDEAASHLTSAEQASMQERVQKWLENHPAESQ